MPTYEYICGKCGHQFEKVQPIAAQSLTVCPKELCPRKKWGRGKVKRAIVSGSGLIFKGSGFYITDYRSDKYKEQSKKETGGGESKAAPAVSEKAGAAPKSEAKSAAPATGASSGGSPPAASSSDKKK